MYLTVPTSDLSPQQFRKKPRSFKPTLNLDDSDSASLDSPQTKVIKSAQNKTSKRFIFPTQERCREIIETLQRLHTLEKQKRGLLKELEKLKEGALNALIEKDETIDKLKEKIQEVESDKDSEGLQRDQYDVQLRIQEVRTQMDMLIKERQQISEEHIATIIKKDKVIVEIGEELQQTISHLTELEVKDQKLAQQISKISEENEQLYDELSKSRASVSQLRNSLKDSQLINLSLVGSIASSPQRKRSGSHHYNLKTEESRECDLKKSDVYLTLQKMRGTNTQQQERHKRQLEHIRQYYEQMLSSASSIHRGLTIPTQENVQSDHSSYGSQQQHKSDLKNEIMLLELQRKLQKHVENPEKRIPTCASMDQNESEFSCKHFQYEIRQSEKDSMFFSKKDAAPIVNTSRHSLKSNLTTYSRRKTKRSNTGQSLKEGVKLGLIAGGVCISISLIIRAYQNRQ